jgi:hypothetical protein
VAESLELLGIGIPRLDRLEITPLPEKGMGPKEAKGGFARACVGPRDKKG